MIKPTVAILLILGVLGAGALRLFPRRAAAVASTTPSAPTTTVTARTIAAFAKATGVVKPCVGAEVRVGSRLSGVVRSLPVRVGSVVTKGQLLAELDDRDLVARRDQAGASLRRAEAELAFARSDLSRKRELGAARVIAPSELDLTERSCAVAEQQVAVARAELTYAETQCDFARIVAPIGGIVASVATQEGETVAASFAAPTFVTLVDLAHLEVWAYVDETDIGRVEAGQTAVFTVDTYPGEDFPGRVTTIYPKAEIRDNVVNYVAVVEFAPPPGRILRPEMTATVRIALVQREQVASLPVEAVQWAEGRPFALVRENDLLVRRPLTLGARDERFLEVVAGLRLGDEVALSSPVSPGENTP